MRRFADLFWLYACFFLFLQPLAAQKNNITYTQSKIISWEGVPNAAQYSLEIQFLGPDNVYHPYISARTSGTSWTGSFMLGTYRSRVTVLDGLGLAGNPSAWNGFKIEAINDLQQPYDELQEKYKALQAENTQLNGKNSQLNTKNTQLNENNTQLNDENKKLAAQLKALNNKKGQTRALVSSIKVFSLGLGAEAGIYDQTDRAEKTAWVVGPGLFFEWQPIPYAGVSIQALGGLGKNNFLARGGTLSIRGYTPEFFRIVLFLQANAGALLFMNTHGKKTFGSSPTTFSGGARYLSLLAGGGGGARVRLAKGFSLELYGNYNYPQGLTFGLRILYTFGKK
jgi:hypothetical protein